MPRLDSVRKLNELYEVFSKAGKLTSGDVEALAGFFKGLPDSGKAKAKDRLLSIYQSSSYSAGMKKRFKCALLDAGFSPTELKRAPRHVDAEKLRLTIERLSDDGRGEGVTKTVTMAALPWEVQPAIDDAVEALKQKARGQDASAEFGDLLVKVVSEAPKHGKPGPVVGFTVELPIYLEEHDADRRLSFSKNGALVGDEYVGE